MTSVSVGEGILLVKRWTFSSVPGRKSYSKQYEFWRRAVRGNLGKKETKTIVPASQAQGAKTFKDPEGVEYAVVNGGTERTKPVDMKGPMARWHMAVDNFMVANNLDLSRNYNTYSIHDIANAYSKNDMVLINLQLGDKADTDYTKELRKQLIRERTFPRYQIPPEMIPKAIKAIERLPGPLEEAMIKFDNAGEYSQDVVPADALYKGLLTLKNTNDEKPLYISLHKEDGNDKRRLMSIMPEDSHFAYVSDLYLEMGSLSLKDIHDISKIKVFNSPAY